MVIKYRDKLHSDVVIRRVLHLFYNLKDNRTAVIAKIVEIKPHQVVRILTKYDPKVKNRDRK